MSTTNPAPQPQPQQAESLYPKQPGFRPEQAVAVGGEILCSEPIAYNLGRRTVKLTVRNTGDRPIQVGSHFHFFEVNRYLEFDRDAAFGCHLNIPATTAIRFEPGDQKEVEVVAYSGKRRVIGFNGLVMGYTGDEDAPTYFPARLRALRRVRQAGFKIAQEQQDQQGQQEPRAQREQGAPGRQDPQQDPSQQHEQPQEHSGQHNQTNRQ